MFNIIDETFSPTEWNSLATHPMQSWEWGEVRKNEGKQIVRFVEYEEKDILRAVYLMTVHPLPYTNFAVGYIPKSTRPSKEFLSYLRSYAHEHNLVFIKLEPNTIKNTIADNAVMVSLSNHDTSPIRQAQGDSMHQTDLGLIQSPHPLFTPWNQILDISLSEADLLKYMHPKTRYNIHLAEKKGVEVHEMTSEEGYQIFEKLYFETCARQKYHGHTRGYHRNVWKTLFQSLIDSSSSEEKGRNPSDLKPYKPYELYKPSTNALRSHILIAFYKDIPLSAYQLWHFKDTLFYVYGGSSEEHKNVMAANLLMWETIKLGKRLGCKALDMWGSLPPTYDTKDPWAGFTKFKQGYGTKFVEYAGSYDLVANPLLYRLYSLAQTLRQKFIL